MSHDRIRNPGGLTRLTAALTLALGLFVLVAQARGDESEPVEITVGGADWGLRESFRNYIEGSIAHGTITVEEGASRNEDGTFHFPLASGQFAPAEGATVAAFDGAVQFYGHAGQLETRVSALRVEIVPGGASLFADVVSKSLSSGEPVNYEDVELAALDVEGVEPVEAEGTTTWSAIPASLTAEGAPAFGGFYSAGAELDPFGFSYEGPGGPPVAEQWTAPGTPAYEEVAAADGVGGADALFADPDNGILHAASAGEVRALDLDTLAELGSAEPAASLPQDGHAFDPETGTVFVVPDSSTAGPVRSFRWDGEAGAYVEGEIALSADEDTLLAYVPDAEKLYAIDGSGFPATEGGTEVDVPVEVATREGAGWEVESYPDLNSEDRAIRGVTVTTEGRLIASRHPYYEDSLAPENIHATEVVELTDTGTALTATPIAGTTPPAPSSSFTFGYQEPVAGPGGTVFLREIAPPAPTAHAIVLTPEGGGFEVSEPLDVGASVYGASVDDVDGAIYLAEAGLERFTVLKGGEAVATVTEPPAEATALEPTSSAAHDGTLYFDNNDAPVRVLAYAHVADSPTIVTHPADVAVKVTGSRTAEAVFSAAATGDPAPQVEWQVRGPGEAAWTEVPGASSGQLTVTAGAGSAGNRYRAVFSNQAGAIATEAATISVQVLPEPDPDPGPDDEPSPSGSGGGSGTGDTPPPPTADPAPAARPLLKRLGGRTRPVARNGVAALALVGCRPPRPCVLRTRRFAAVRVGRRAFRARVLAPKAVRAGGWASVRLWLPPPPRRVLAGRRGRVTVPVVVRSGGQRVVRRLGVVLRSVPARGGRGRAAR